ncbi:MAG: GatB/YqeY domain-containing protein [Actinomycetota bacterium]|nr:GatB/YqeY domain-containing protein [Actinomycetota bacterium]
MNLTEQIQRDTKEAMKSRDRARASALRMLSAALKNAELETGQPLNEDEQQAVLRRQLKQREESAESFRKAGREEQAEKESAEAKIIRSYLPAPPSPEELEQIVDRAIAETGASGMKDMGSAMGRAMALAEGRAEGRELSALVRSRLQQ